MPSLSIALDTELESEIAEAVTEGGGTVASLADAAAFITNRGPSDFPTTLPPNISWVQLGSAGVDGWHDVFDAHPDVVFTSATGAYSDTVAEHALMMLLAGVRNLRDHLAADTWQRERLIGTVGTLRGSRVAIVGAGGIGRALIAMLAPVGASVTAVTRSGTDVPGAALTLPATRLDEVWPHCDHVVIAAPATSDTEHLVGAEELKQLRPHSWLINIARGPLVDTDALVDALTSGTIAGAGLDVTDPEPLPDGHPLWSLPNVIITPHDSNPPAVRTSALALHVRGNVSRFVADRPLLSIVDRTTGY